MEWRSRWQAQITDAGLVDGWFGIPVGDELPPIPAPPRPTPFEGASLRFSATQRPLDRAGGQVELWTLK